MIEQASFASRGSFSCRSTGIQPGATMLTKQYSIPTEPGPDTGKVSGFLVW